MRGKQIKRMFIGYGGTKQLVEIPPPPKKPTYADVWKEHEKTLQRYFANKLSFYTWSGKKYARKEFPTVEQIILDRKQQMGMTWTTQV